MILWKKYRPSLFPLNIQLLKDSAGILFLSEPKRNRQVSRLTAMYGEGEIDDDFFHTGEKNLEYSGWVAPIACQSALRRNKRLFQFTNRYS